MTKKELREILNNMTLEEKLCQMTQAEPRYIKDRMAGEVNPESNKNGLTDNQYYALGSIITYVAKENDMRMIQEDHMAHDRNKIPLLFMSDVVHGKETVFPIPLAMACSFNRDLVKTACEAAAEEAAVSGIHTVFAPVCDLSRDARWGRVMESYGEDPYLNSQMAASSVKGFQGDGEKIDEKHVSSCVKHYLGYGACIGGRDYNSCDISETEIYNMYLPPFNSAAETGVSMAMTSFNTLNGVPMTINKEWLKNYREKTKFKDSIFISDYNSVEECTNHGITEDKSKLAKLCIDATLDIEMMSTVILNESKNLVENGLISEKDIDDSVMRILQLKNRLGLFENPFRGMNAQKEAEFQDNLSRREKSRKCAQQCAVLLKNNGVLPINKSEKIGLAGPFALSDEVGGEWAFSMLKPRNVSLYEGLREKNKNITVAYADKIKKIKGSRSDDITEIPDYKDVFLFNNCDKIIVTVGQHMGDSGEAASMHTIALSHNQINLVKRLKKLGKPIIAVVFSGRPLDLSSINNYCDAILYGWYLGCETGNALADLLTGDANPSGKLAMSLPASIGQIPVYYNHLPSGRIKTADNLFGTGYTDFQHEPLYPFGYGLSYSKFEYSNFSIAGSTVKIKVKNVSDAGGMETVQLYIRDCFASVSRPVKELKGFKKIYLKAGEEKIITFILTKDMLSFYIKDKKAFESGKFIIYVGTDSMHCLEKDIYINDAEWQ